MARRQDAIFSIPTARSLPNPIETLRTSLNQACQHFLKIGDAAKLRANYSTVSCGIKLKIITYTILALIGALLLLALWQIFSPTPASIQIEGVETQLREIETYPAKVVPSMWWVVGLLAVVFVGALPFLFGLAMASKGQSASGWLIFIGGIFSAVAICLLLAIYFLGSLVYALVGYLFF